MKLSHGCQILKTTFTDFFADKALQLSAALAYYAVFSLGPLLILVISIAGLVYDKAVAGAISAYTAAIFLLIGVAALIALGIQAAGLSPLLSVGLRAMAVFLLVGATGYLLVRKGGSALGESLLPEKTLQTLGKKIEHDPKVTLKDSRSSDELQKQVESTQDLLGQDLDTLKARLMPKRLFRVFLVDQIKQHPFRLISFAATTLVTGFQIARRLRKRVP